MIAEVTSPDKHVYTYQNNMVLANLKSIYIMHSKEVANRLLPNHFCAKIQTPLLQTDYSHLFCLADVKVESPAA
jgi:hypothetical protein